MAAPFDLAESPVGAYFAQMAELGVMRLLTEYGVLAAIPDAGAGDGTGIAVEALAEALAPRVEYALLERFCRLLVASGTLVAPAPGRVARTPRAAAMADPAAAGFFNYLYDFFLGPAARWPAYFAAQGGGAAEDASSGGPGGRLAEPATSRRCPAGFALGHPDKTAYEILAALPAQANTLNGAMAVEGDIPITGFYDFGWLAAAHVEDADKARPLLVDVGGGKGQALSAILGAHAGIPADRCVLQDQAAVVAVAQAEHEATPGHPLRAVRKAGASFFEASPVPGARAYYVRRVLNDWADAEAAAILGRLRAACAPDSRVLVAEYLRPEPADPGAPALVPAAVDMFIMSIGGKVRSEAMFRALAARAGFEVVRVAREQRTGSAVLELVPV